MEIDRQRKNKIVVAFPNVKGFATGISIRQVPALWMIFDMVSWARAFIEELQDIADTAALMGEYLDTAAFEDAAGLVSRWLDNPNETIQGWPDLRMRQELGPPLITVDLIGDYMQQISFKGETVSHEPLLQVDTLLITTEREILSINPLVEKYTGPDFHGVMMHQHQIQNRFAETFILPKISAVLGGMLLETWYGDEGNEGEKND